jgi:hypothetical protein
MAYIGNDPSNRFVAPKAAKQFSGDGSTTAFTLDHAVGSDEDILVSVDGVIQEPSVAYAVSNGTTLTFTAAPSSNSGNNIFVYYLFRTVGTVSHPSNNALQATTGNFTGAVTANSGVTVDNITIDGNDISSTNSDGDILFKGNDGGSTITALTLDMSDAGTATFNNNVGVGASPNNHGGMNRVLEVSASTDVQLALHATSDSIADGNRIGEVAFLAGSDSTLPIVASIVGRVNGTSENQGQLTFHTRHTDTGGAPAERLRINEQGMFMLNGTNEIARLVISQDTQALNMCFLQNTNSTTGGNYFVFSNSGGSTAGTINQNGSTTVAYNTSSDYRLKENVSYDFDATARLKQLKPARFNWIEDETNTLVDGFLAHEVSSIVPEAVTGKKDATKDVPNVVLNADGTVKAQGISEEDWTQGKSDGIYENNTTWVASKNIIDAQGIDHSKLVPLLTKSLQEALAEIDTLKTKVAALESK